MDMLNACIGDVVDKTPELTPVAIMAGRLLARRLVNPVGTEVSAYTVWVYMCMCVYYSDEYT